MLRQKYLMRYVIKDKGENHLAWRLLVMNKSKFGNLEHHDDRSVKFRNNEPFYVKGKGYITLTDELRCDNTCWVEGLEHNLLSVA